MSFRNAKLLLVGVLVGGLTVSSMVFANQPLHLVVNGVEISRGDEPRPLIIDNRVYVPARPLAEALGATVQWDSGLNSVVVTKKEPTEFTSSKDEGIVNLWEKSFSNVSPSSPLEGKWEVLKGERVINGFLGSVSEGRIVYNVSDYGLKPNFIKGYLSYQHIDPMGSSLKIEAISNNGDLLYRSGELKDEEGTIMMEIPVKDYTTNVSIVITKYSPESKYNVKVARGKTYISIKDLCLYGKIKE